MFRLFLVAFATTVVFAQDLSDPACRACSTNDDCTAVAPGCAPWVVVNALCAMDFLNRPKPPSAVCSPGLPTGLPPLTACESGNCITTGQYMLASESQWLKMIWTKGKDGMYRHRSDRKVPTSVLEVNANEPFSVAVKGKAAESFSNSTRVELVLFAGQKYAIEFEGLTSKMKIQQIYTLKKDTVRKLNIDFGKDH